MYRVDLDNSKVFLEAALKNPILRDYKKIIFEIDNRVLDAKKFEKAKEVEYNFLVSFVLAISDKYNLDLTENYIQTIYNNFLI